MSNSDDGGSKRKLLSNNVKNNEVLLPFYPQML